MGELGGIADGVDVIDAVTPEVECRDAIWSSCLVTTSGVAVDLGHGERGALGREDPLEPGNHRSPPGSRWPQGPRDDTAGVELDDDVGVQDLDERLEVPLVARGGEALRDSLLR